MGQDDLQRAGAQPLRSDVPLADPDTGHYGTVTPQAAYQQGGYNCREYTQTVYIDGRSEQAHGTACRQADGSWQIQN